MCTDSTCCSCGALSPSFYYAAQGCPDGIKLDKEGNVYAGQGDGVASPAQINQPPLASRSVCAGAR